MGDLLRFIFSFKSRSKKHVEASDEPKSLRRWYGLFFKLYNIPPSTLAKERPRLLFDMLNNLEDKPSMADVPDDMKWFYGE